MHAPTFEKIFTITFDTSMMDLSLLLRLEPYTTAGMSVFQMDNFVIKDQMTPYRKLRQAIIEARARLENITSMGFDLEELQIKKEQVQKASPNAEPLEQRLQDVQIRRYEFEINRKQAIIDQQQREVEFFLQVINDVTNTHFGGEQSAVTLFENKQFHLENEEQFWIEKLSRGVYSDLLNYGTISKGVSEAIANLTVEQQQNILASAADQQLLTVLQLDKSKTRALAVRD